MPKRDADLLIEDMRLAIERIERYTAGLNREAFLRIVHDYFGLDLKIIWEIISHDIASLFRTLDFNHLSRWS